MPRVMRPWNPLVPGAKPSTKRGECSTKTLVTLLEFNKGIVRIIAVRMIEAEYLGARNGRSQAVISLDASR